MTKLRLRGHHLYCLRFTEMQFHERGEHFQNTYTEIRNTLNTSPDSMIEVVLGPDDLCKECPISSANGCQSKQGGEPVVKKWDNIVLGGLGIETYREMPVREYQAIIDQKSPISFCYRCKVGMDCKMRALALSKNNGPC